MSLVFSLAEAINVGWGEVAGHGGQSLASRLEDWQFRRSVVQKLQHGNVEVHGRAGRRVLSSPGFIKWLEEGATAPIDQYLTDGELQDLGADSLTIPQIGIAFGEAIAATAFRKADWVDREILRRLDRNDEAGERSVRLLQDIWHLLSEDDDAQRRADRVLELHRELTRGETNGARLRLVNFLKSRRRHESGSLMRVTPAQLRSPLTIGFGGARSVEDLERLSTDLSVLTRFFEEADTAFQAGMLDDYMYVKLVGAHAGWFARAINHDKIQGAADRANSYADGHQSKFPGWGTTRNRDFGPDVIEDPG